METKYKKYTCTQKNKPNRKHPKEEISPAGNRTPVSRVTGGDTHHYTTEDSVIQHHVLISQYLRNTQRTEMSETNDSLHIATNMKGGQIKYPTMHHFNYIINVRTLKSHHFDMDALE